MAKPAPSRSACRRLFDVDHQYVKADLKRLTANLDQQITEKYNFDFKAEKGLPGKYAWKKVISYVPQAYDLPHLSRRLLIRAPLPRCTDAQEMDTRKDLVTEVARSSSPPTVTNTCTQTKRKGQTLISGK